MNLGKILTRNAHYRPNHAAIFDSCKNITYAELEYHSNCLASGLLNRNPITGMGNEQRSAGVR